MARVHTSNIFEGQERGWNNEQVLARKQLVVVEPPISYELAWHGANQAGVNIEDLGTIEVRHSETVADTHLGSVVLLSETNTVADGEPRPEAEFVAEGAKRLNAAVANIATLASMGTTSQPQNPTHRATLDAGMAVMFPGSSVFVPIEASAPGV